jgi:dTDP-4-amino-4,6-dideoxygalactose transaminase
MKGQGIYTRKYFYPLTSDQACFKNRYRGVSLECAREMAKRVLVLPVYEGLSGENLEKIIKICLR